MRLDIVMPRVQWLLISCISTHLAYREVFICLLQIQYNYLVIITVTHVKIDRLCCQSHTQILPVIPEMPFRPGIVWLCFALEIFNHLVTGSLFTQCFLDMPL